MKPGAQPAAACPTAAPLAPLWVSRTCHDDPNGLGSDAAAGRACTSERADGRYLCSGSHPGASHEAPFEEGEAGAATHLALEPFHARDLPLHRPTTPGQRHPSFACVEIIAASFGKPSPGAHGTLDGTREPGLELLGLPLAHELGKVLGEVDRLAYVRMLRTQLGELLGVVLGALLRMPHHQPGRLTSGEDPVVGLSDDGEGEPAPSWPRRLALRLAQALGIARNGGIAPRIAALLELTIEAQGIVTAGVPSRQELGCIGVEDTVAAVTASPALGQGGRAEIAKHRILADAKMGGNGRPRPPLVVQRPNLPLALDPACPTLGRLLRSGR